jgi:hypothetical protein
VLASGNPLLNPNSWWVIFWVVAAVPACLLVVGLLYLLFRAWLDRG